MTSILVQRSLPTSSSSRRRNPKPNFFDQASFRSALPDLLEGFSLDSSLVSRASQRLHLCAQRFFKRPPPPLSLDTYSDSSSTISDSAATYRIPPPPPQREGTPHTTGSFDQSLFRSALPDLLQDFPTSSLECRDSPILHCLYAQPFFKPPPPHPFPDIDSNSSTISETSTALPASFFSQIEGPLPCVALPGKAKVEPLLVWDPQMDILLEQQVFHPSSASYRHSECVGQQPLFSRWWRNHSHRSLLPLCIGNGRYVLSSHRHS